MIVLERLTQLYRQAVAELRGSGKLQAPSLASLQRSTRDYVPGLAGRLAIATGLLVALAVGAMSVFEHRRRCAVSPTPRGSRASSSPCPRPARACARAPRIC